MNKLYNSNKLSNVRNNMNAARLNLSRARLMVSEYNQGQRELVKGVGYWLNQCKVCERALALAISKVEKELSAREVARFTAIMDKMQADRVAIDIERIARIGRRHRNMGKRLGTLANLCFPYARVYKAAVNQSMRMGGI